MGEACYEGGNSASLQRHSMALCAFSNQNFIILEPPPSRVKVVCSAQRKAFDRKVVELYMHYLNNLTSDCLDSVFFVSSFFENYPTPLHIDGGGMLRGGEFCQFTAA